MARLSRRNRESTKTMGQCQKKLVLNTCLDYVVSELSLGNYENAMYLINKGLKNQKDHSEVMGLLELKNIIIRLRLKCEAQLVLGPTQKSNALPNSFTIEMLDVVQKVLRCSNHYEVLRVSHHASYSEVKRAYKKLALRLHPDKNSAPGSQQAFRRISEAADCLTDSQKRTEYNIISVVGAEQFKQDTLYTACTRNASEEAAPDEEEEELPECRQPYQPANQRVPQRQILYQTEQLVIGLVAAVIFMFITLQFVATTPNYSFSPTSIHSVRHVSGLSQVTYYLTPELASNLTPQQKIKLEREIEQVYVTELKQTCKQEHKLRETWLLRASRGNNPDLHKHVLEMATPACQTLIKMSQTRHKPLLLENQS